MLFDLIKCHARLFSLQRDRDADGGVIAREEDFVAAAKLFSALAGTAGSQEMKLTKNEAAAIATVARMGIDMFTIRELQSALGLSYHQTYRLLHGYTNNRTTYAGILEKCPAVSYIDTTVTANDDGGSTTSRSTLRPTAPGRHRPRSGWTMSPTVPVARGVPVAPGGLTTFTLLHLVYTRIRGKV